MPATHPHATLVEIAARLISSGVTSGPHVDETYEDYIARAVNELIGQRDRARSIAVALEQENDQLERQLDDAIEMAAAAPSTRQEL